MSDNERRVADGVERAVDAVHGLVGDDGDVPTFVENVREVTGRANQAVDGARAVVDGARRIADALQGRATSRVRLTFECDTVDAQWNAESATVEEELGRPYQARIELRTEDLNAEPPALLGQSCRLLVERGSVLRRVLGVITEVNEAGSQGREQRATILVEPALALLRHRTNTRIFQEQTVPAILKVVLGEGLEASQRTLESRLNRGYPVCEYRTQFDETDLDFCQRLMEEEGIFYWFENDDDVEKMVLADDAGEYGEVETVESGAIELTEYEGTVGGHEYVSALRVTSQLRPTRVTTRHHDWTNPDAPIEGDSSAASGESDDDESDDVDGARLGPEREEYEHDVAPLTMSEFDQRYGRNDVEDQIQLRREQQAYDARRGEGESTVVGFAAGLTFELVGHPRPDNDRRYLLLSVSSRFDEECHNSFSCIPAEVPFRLRRRTPRPRVSGVQTARVVGPNGEEIHTDEHGRIKVQFHWDRQGQRDEHSSCWVQVVQPWAGSGWGFVFIPRIDMEVVITFLNGDADRPICTGAVYNGQNIPPYSLPDQKTRSGIKTESSLGGDGYNELTFEDEAGEEQIIVHAQRDYNETVENNHSTTVHGSQTNTVDGDHTNTIGMNHTESVGKSQTLTVEGDRQATVRGKQDFFVEGGDSMHKVTSASYLLETNNEVTVRAPNKITLDCGGSSRIVMTPGEIVFSAGGGAKVVLNEDVFMTSNAEATVLLDENVLAVSQAGANFLLNADALLRESGNGSVVSLTSSEAHVTGAGNAHLKLTDKAQMESARGSTVELAKGATVEGAQGGTLALTADCHLESAAGGTIDAEGPTVKLNG